MRISHLFNLFASILLLVSTGHAYDVYKCGLNCTDQNGPVTWPVSVRNAVLYKIDKRLADSTDDLTSDKSTCEAIVTSFDAWSSASSDSSGENLILTLSELITDGQASEDGSNEVFFVESGWADQTDTDSSTIALTTISWDKDGNILDSDMRLNGEDYVWDTIASESTCLEYADTNKVTVVDVQNVVTHEAGHFIGIDHSSVAVATMAATATPCETNKRTLETDDIEATQFLYSTPGTNAEETAANCDSLSSTIGSNDDTTTTTTTSNTGSSSGGGGGCSCAIGPESQNDKGAGLFLLAFIPLGLLLRFYRYSFNE